MEPVKKEDYRGFGSVIGEKFGKGMAVPKAKRSKSKSRTRLSNWKRKAVDTAKKAFSKAKKAFSKKKIENEKLQSDEQLSNEKEVIEKEVVSEITKDDKVEDNIEE